MTNSVIFQFIQTPDNASSEWCSWGSRLCFHTALWCRRRANCDASFAKAGASLTVTELDRISQRWRRRTASQQGAQEKQRNDHLTALSLQLIPGYFWKNNPGTHFIISTEILRGSSQWRSTLWNIL